MTASRTAAKPRMARKAVTIVATDLVGYSRMMAHDEEGVIERLREARAAVIDPAIAAGHGRIIKTMGDGLLLEFTSPAEAVQAALTVQRAMAIRAAAESDSGAEPLRLRIGINHGEVVIDGDDVLGDVVNIAARLESIAPAGGVCISRAVQEQVSGIAEVSLTPLGPQFVKNIPTPVEAWRIEIEGVTAELPTAVARNERPSVAVLAFDNLSADPDQGYLADGVAEDVTTQLARFRSLFVVARNSSFAYRGESHDLRRVARELGVRYVVTGSVRRGGDRLRVSAHLVEGETGVQVWTGHWDRDLSDLFDLQDELTHSIITDLAPELGANERRLARRKPTDNLNAWELTQRGLSEFYTYTPLGYLTAYELFHQAIATDAEFALPRALLGRWHAVLIFSGRAPDPAAEAEAGLEHAQAAKALDDRLEDVDVALAMVYSAMGRVDDARDAIARASALNDNHPGVYQAEQFRQLFSPEPDPAAMEHAAWQSLAISPREPLTWSFHWMVAVARWIRDGDLSGSAREPLEAACRLPQAEYFVLMSGAVVSLRSGRVEEARRLLERAAERNPLLSKRLLIDSFHFPVWPELARTVDRDLDALTELGLPAG